MDNTVSSDRIDQDAALDGKLRSLRNLVKELGSALVAYSGGVDSAFLVKVAFEQLSEQVLAVTADSESIPRSELDAACRLARAIGVRHLVINTGELKDPLYIANAPDRCYHCKRTLFVSLTEIARQQGFRFVLEGSNFSDLADYRPGLKAVNQFRVRSPLREAGLTKDEIRTLSKQAGLPTWDKPAAPCLSSRIPYGSAVTTEKLRRIEAAEAFLRPLGFRELRVRDYDTAARIEVPMEDIPRLQSDALFPQVERKLKELGYQSVIVDPRGFRSGSLNEAILKDPHGPK
ncbi:MAG: ATP-dependent sacrificial sulfur transferase LarE [Candidatus Zixiibacteriota bacterium]